MPEPRSEKAPHFPGGGYVLLRVDIPDSGSLRSYGIDQLSGQVLEDAEGGNYTYRYEVVEAHGPTTASRCWRCGCQFHGNDACESCDHPFCVVATNPSLIVEPTMEPSMVDDYADWAADAFGSRDGSDV